MQTVGLKSGDLGDAERRIQTTWEVNLSASIITQIQQIPNVCPCRILPDETGLQSILTKPITTDHGPCFSMIYLCDKLQRRHALVLLLMMIIIRFRWCVLKQCWRVFNLVAKQPTNQPTRQAGQAKPQEADNLKRGLPRSSFFSRSKNCTMKICSVQCCVSV